MERALATLPMYDWPEVRVHTDRLWAAMREAIRDAGLRAPELLDRTIPLEKAWIDPGLVLGQTCGMPYRRRLHDRVTLIGAPDYGVEGCPPGFYRSFLVVRRDDAREELSAYANADFAFNAPDSESGYAALMRTVEPLAREAPFFGRAHRTGSHAGSICAVAYGEAEIAAIDAVTWRFAVRFEPSARRLRVLSATKPTPGLPYICARGLDAGTMAVAVEAGLAALAPEERKHLGIRGFVQLSPADYLKYRETG